MLDPDYPWHVTQFGHGSTQCAYKTKDGAEAMMKHLDLHWPNQFKLYHHDDIVKWLAENRQAVPE